MFSNMVKKSPRKRSTFQEIKKSKWYNGEVLSKELLKDFIGLKFNLND